MKELSRLVYRLENAGLGVASRGDENVRSGVSLRAEPSEIAGTRRSTELAVNRRSSSPNQER
jgi:hypothetical protein